MNAPASFRESELQAPAEVQQCREEKAHLQAECSGQVGLTGLFENGWMDEEGVAAWRLKEVIQRPGDSLIAQKVISYRLYPGPTVPRGAQPAAA